MKTTCSWCTADLGDKPPLDDPRTSHGICPECLDKQLEGLDVKNPPSDATAHALTFDEWKRAVDLIVAGRLAGLTTDDLPDKCYAVWFDDGLSPNEAADECLDEEGMGDED